jgi:glycosyltransferase involved in cell wall biosynthesis
VVLEACSRGVPVVVVCSADNAAAELIVEGENGLIAHDASPAVLATAIVQVYESQESLRSSTLVWFRANARRYSLESSLRSVFDAYESRF